MKKLLLLLLCLPIIGFGQQIADNNMEDDIFLTVLLYIGHIVFAVLILQAGQKSNNGRLQVAGFLYMLLTLFSIMIILSKI